MDNQVSSNTPEPGTIEVYRPNVDPEDDRLLAEAACRASGFETKWQEPRLGHSYRGDPKETDTLTFGIPNGRYTRWIDIGKSRARVIQSIGITPVVALGDYEAILYKDNYEIEAKLGSLTPRAPVRYERLSRLPGVIVNMDKPSDSDADEIVEASDSWTLPFVNDTDQEWSASIGIRSDRFRIYCGGPYLRVNNITLKIVNPKVSRHDEALQLLEKVANAILFELDLCYGLAFRLARFGAVERTLVGGASQARSHRLPASREISEEPPRLPRNSYPAKPLSLYWYARSAIGMPLLEYLAAYQILEYYFSTYFQRETLDRIKQELLDPRFSPQRDADLVRLLNLATPQGKSFGGEREQLKATIRACVSAAGLEDYLKEPARQEFFSGKQAVKDVARIDLRNSAADIRDQVADRVYDIRCRIVHTKSGIGDRYPELLLPFSDEAASLAFDIQLIQYLAQRILIHRAQPFNIS